MTAPSGPGPATSALSVWAFDSPEGAAAALRVLERWQTLRRLTVDDTAVVTWGVGQARPLAYQAGTVDGAAALTGAFWGLLFGTVFLVPMLGGGPPSAGLDRVGLPDELLLRLRQLVGPGRSALLLLTDAAGPDHVGAALAGTHHAVLVAPLAGEQDRLLRWLFGTDDAVPC